MYIKRFLPITACAVLLLFVSGCARYAARPLHRLMVPAHKKEQSISFEYHIFTPSDCKRYLDRNVIAKRYQPVHITLVNNAKRAIYFSTDAFDVPCVYYEEVAHKMHTSTVKRVVGYGVVGLFIWPFMIPAIVDGINSEEANKQLDADFSCKALVNQIVPPYSTVNGLIFVPTESFHKDFSFSVLDSEKSERYLLSTQNKEVKI